VFFFYFERKIYSGSCEKFRNVILFTDYIKFDPQTFDCYIYFVLNICFFNFIPSNLIFILTLVFIFIIVIWFSLIIFSLNFFIYQIWSSFFLLLLILFEIIYEMLIIIIILISSSFNFLFFRFDLYYFDYYLFYLK